MIHINSTVSVTILSVSGPKYTKLKAETKWIIQDPTICCLQETNFKYRHVIRSKRMEEGIPCKHKQKAIRNTYVNFRLSRLLTKERYQRFKRALCDDKGISSLNLIPVHNVYALNNHFKIWGKNLLDESTIIGGDFISIRNVQL